MSRSLPRIAAILMGAVALSGCVSLLPKGDPAKLYSFGQSPAEAPAPVTGQRIGILRANGAFQQQSAGDRILALTNGEAAYIGETRWVAPAAVLFDQAMSAKFENEGAPLRLVTRGEPSRAAYALRVDVRNFETRYERGPESAPAVVVRTRVVFTSFSDRDMVAEQILEARAQASDNRVAAIVAAYDKATDDMLGQILDWAKNQAQTAGPTTPAPTTASRR